MTIVRKIKCSNSDCPHERLKKFSDWVREKLPDSAGGFYITDIDFVIYNKKSKKLLMIEQKVNGANVKQWQREIFSNIKTWIANGINGDYTFNGFHLLQFEKYFFDDGKVYYNGKEVSEGELVEIISLL